MSNWVDWDRCPPGETLRDADPEIAELIEEEITRQNDGIELIASENFVSPAVMEAMGSPLTNKYAEGLPGRRYYGGCEVVDQVEQLAIDRVKELFGAEHANVQPHSGAQANAAVYLAFLKPGDTVLGLDLSQGGHLTHGSPVNFSGLLYHAVSYGVTGDGIIDYEQMRAQARAHRPKMIIAGYSAYSRTIDWQAFADVATECRRATGIELVSSAARRSELMLWLDNRLRPMFDGRVLPVTEDVLLKWRLIIENGRKGGYTFSHPDVLIAATAAHHDLVVVTRNVREFAAAGVGVLDPWTGKTTEER